MGKILNISIVLYNSEFDQINSLVKLLKTVECVNTIYLIDNSPLINKNFDKCEAIYIFNNENIGYGSGHNIAIQNSCNEDIKYHLVLNSDIRFDNSVIPKLLEKLEQNDEIAMIMPKVLNDNRTIQFLPKLLPTPFNLLIRVISPLGVLFKSINKKYTLENYYDLELNVPILSGCFSLFRVEALKQVGFYDDKFFMYFEDFDLSRRIHSKFKTIYYPNVSIVHLHERGAAKSLKLFSVFVKSAVNYFNKYGWFYDPERRLINKNVLNDLK